MCSAVVSTRIDKKAKETLRKAGIDISAEARNHLKVSQKRSELANRSNN